MGRQIIRLHPDDNVAIALVDLCPGQTVALDGQLIQVRDAVDTGHKVALQDLKTGQKLYRNQMPIGSATRQILTGQHVHLHNLKSDYIDTLNAHYAKRGDAAQCTDT